MNKITGMTVSQAVNWTRRKIRSLELAGNLNREKPNSERGESLDETTRSEMESALGYNLKNVHIYKSKKVSNLARDMEADAFTIGSNIFIPEANIKKASNTGKGLLAHELVHVIQQTQPPHTLAADPRLSINQDPSSNRNYSSTFGKPLDSAYTTIPQLAPSIPKNSEQTSIIKETEAEAETAESNIKNEINKKTLVIPSAEELAEQVYEFMKRDLLIESDRRH